MKMIVLFVAFIVLLCGATSAQNNQSSDADVPKWQINAGLGTMNSMYWILNLSKQYYSNYDLDKKNNVFLKVEKRLGRRSGLGINYAQAGVDVNAVLTIDSVFNNELQHYVPTEVAFKYRTQSVNLRYNFHFAPSSKWDPYVGIGLGLRFNSVDASVSNPLKTLADLNLDIPFITFTTPGADFTLGVNANHFSDKFGFYAEFGMAKALLQAGIQYRF